MNPKHNNMAHWTSFERGRHFPMMEQPDLLAGGFHVFFRPLG